MRNFFCFVFICLLLTGCSSGAPEAAFSTPTVAPTSTHILSTTPAETSTATITLTVAPSATPTPTKTPTRTPTPPPSITPTPTQTPLGGSSGEIAYIGYVRENDGGLKLFNLQTNAATYLNLYGTWLAWSLDGTTLAYVGFPLTRGSFSDQVCTYLPEKKQEFCVALENNNVSLPFSISPHGTEILIDAYDKDNGTFEIYRINPPDGSQSVIANGSNPTWAPDGKTIAFTNDGRIFTMALDGSDPKLLVAQSGNDQLTFSPDGTRLAYTSHKNGNTDVYSAALDGAQTRHSTAAGYDLYPAWSPDGKQLAYVSPYQMSYSGFLGDIFVVDLATNTSKKITEQAAAMPSAPSWSPDGQWITFHGCKTTEDKERCALFIVRSDGSEMIQLSAYEMYTSNPVWRP